MLARRVVSRAFSVRKVREDSEDAAAYACQMIVLLVEGRECCAAERELPAGSIGEPHEQRAGGVGEGRLDEPQSRVPLPTRSREPEASNAPPMLRRFVA